GAVGFELPRRQIDDEAVDLAAPAGFEFGCNQLEMRRPQQFSLRVQLVERPIDKAHQIAAQDTHQIAAQDSRIIGGHSSISWDGRIASDSSSSAIGGAATLSGDELRIRAMMPSRTFRSSGVSRTWSGPASARLPWRDRASFNKRG